MSNEFKGRTGVDRIVRAAGHSWSGLRLAYAGESAFRQEFWLAALTLPAAFWLGRDWVQVALLAGSVLLVLIVELLNSGIEAVVDRVSYEWHELSKRAKDLGSAAVMLSLWQRWQGG
jgi:diacylglycerol kinase (ATP)